ncbi:MAG TPA: porin [Usitatibacteraceae bacterium]
MKKTTLAFCIAALFTASAASTTAFAGEAELLQRLDQLGNEIESLKAELKRIKEEKEREKAAQIAAPAAAIPAPAQTATAQPGVTMPGLASFTNGQTTLFGYGEINYNRPRRDSSQTQADVRRFVIGVGHRFNEKTEFAAELENEHAIASSSDKGEMAVEQLYIDHRPTDNLTVRGGLFLVPLGLINERHEPPTFYGVERNFVETAIIPSTWREGGILLRGHTDEGLHWDAGVSTGFDLSKWDAASSEGRESPLGSIHQELSLAKARDLSIVGALNWRGTPGFNVGGGFFTGKAAQGTPGFAAPEARITIVESHARWTPGAWDISALYAKGTISHTEALNLTFVGNPTLVPKEFWGAYGQVAYKLWSQGDYSFSPFVRYERFNTAAKFADIGAGLTPDAAATESVITTGASFKLHPNVVLKADYQKFKVDNLRDRFNLGLGFMF